jgi:ribosomal protein S18 acetylase RimI-like enzyme
MITYRNAKDLDMPDVAELHIACFKGTFIASLGKRLIADYYHEFLSEGGPFVLAYDEDNLIGLCMGYYKGSQARNKFVSKNKIRLGLRLIALCLSCNKLAMSKCWNYLLPTKKGANDGKPRIEAESDLLSICVREDYRGQGVSKGLVDEFEKQLKEAGKKDVTLSVYTTNERALTFYKKIGYTIVGESIDEYKMYKAL